MSTYLNAVRNTIKLHNIEARLEKLEGKETLTEDEREELDNIDKTMKSIMLNDGSKLQPQRTSDSFSDKLHEMKQVKHYTKEILHLKGTESPFLLQKYNAMHNEANINLTRGEIKEEIVKASGKIEELQKRCKENRIQMLENMARHEE